ncbi:nuclear transport factor 2 family protein [Caulobacter mirabilis]|uniref:Ketosteroid isomerase n=1 Tax=Caulobacter mirabilis TaxID=69666 RepID=A0A2D2AU22_9CAUL|nr:nuclear transport factor 2 family protein [Caulobacter mirabilis]ATQ41499.1 ketosteroid isomerase [Caulobacter mirabilis]
MSIKDIADDFAALCKAGEFDAAGAKYWSADVVSIEAQEGDMQRAAGLDAVRGKGEWWAANHEIHGFETEGPFVNGDQFAMIFRMDVTQKASGQRVQMDEVATYTVKGGKIVEERFYY